MYQPGRRATYWAGIYYVLLSTYEENIQMRAATSTYLGGCRVRGYLGYLQATVVSGTGTAWLHTSKGLYRSALGH